MEAADEERRAVETVEEEAAAQLPPLALGDASGSSAEEDMRRLKETAASVMSAEEIERQLDEEEEAQWLEENGAGEQPEPITQGKPTGSGADTDDVPYHLVLDKTPEGSAMGTAIEGPAAETEGFGLRQLEGMSPNPLAAEALVEDIMRRPKEDAEKQPGKIRLDRKPEPTQDERAIFRDETLEEASSFAPLAALTKQQQEDELPPPSSAALPPEVIAALADDIVRRPALDAEKQPGKLSIEKTPDEALRKDESSIFKDQVLDELEEEEAWRARFAAGPNQAPTFNPTILPNMEEALSEDIARRPEEGAEKQPGPIALDRPREASDAAADPALFKDEVMDDWMLSVASLAAGPAPAGTPEVRANIRKPTKPEPISSPFGCFWDVHRSEWYPSHAGHATACRNES